MKTIRTAGALIIITLHLFFAGTAFGLTEAVTPLTDPGQAFNYVDPALSPCGNFVAFARATTGSSYANTAMAARRTTGGWEMTALTAYAEKAVLSPGMAVGGEYAVFAIMGVSQGGAALTPEDILLVANPAEAPTTIDLKAAFTAAFGEPVSLFDPSFSPCGFFLVFCAYAFTDDYGVKYGIYRMNLASGEIVEVFSAGDRINGPSVSAGGGRVAFAYWDQEAFGSSIGVADWDAKTFYPVPGVVPGGMVWPVISADGRWVAFNNDGTSVIAVAQVNGGGAETVVSLAGSSDRGQRVALSSDGRYIAYYETDSYGHKRAYIQDRLTPGSRRLMSRKETGESATGAFNPYDAKAIGLSGDGAVCAFSMASSDIVPGANENFLGVYMSDGTGMAAPASSLGTPEGAFLAGGGDEESPTRISLPVHSVNVATLSLVMKGTLFHMPGWGYPVHVTLTYNSADTWEGKFGPRWSMNYESLCHIGPSSVKVRKGTGEVLAFSLPGGESLLQPLGREISLTPPDGVTESLMVSDTLITRTRLKDLVRFEYTRVSTSDDAAWLTAIVDRNGNRVTINRSASDPGRITSVNDPYGRQLLFYYNDSGQCTRIEPPGGGRSIELAYGSTSGRLYRITDMVRNTAEYEYNSNGELTGVRNGTPVQYVSVDPGSPEPEIPAGIPVRRATFSYALRSADAGDPLQGFLVREVRENNLDPVYYEPVSGKPGQVRRTSRGLKPFIYGSNLQKKIERFTDPLGNTSLVGYTNNLPASVTTPKGDETKIEYNPSGFPIRITDPLGQISRYEYKGGTGLVTRYIPPGLTSEQSWRIEYDTRHNPIRTTSPLGRVTEMTYGTKGELLSVRDAAGNMTTLTYDQYGNPLSIRRPGDPAATQLTWDDTGLRCTRLTDPLGNAKDFLYDPNDRLTRVTWPSLSGAPHIDLEWDAFHQSRLIDELDHASTFEHNLFGQRTATTSPLGQIRRSIYDTDNRLIASQDPLSRVTTRTYDDSGRLTAIQYPIGESLRTYDKDGRQISYRTPSGGITNFAYDKNGNRTQAAPAGLAPVNLSYTARNQLASVTNARGQTVSHSYNLDGELTARSIPDLGQDTFSYDSRGKLTAMTSAQGASSTRAYDANGRVIQIQWPKPGGGDFTAGFVYDAADRLTRITYPDGTIANLAHDARNRAALPASLRNASLREMIPPGAPLHPLTMTWSKGGTSWTATAAADAAGNLRSLTRPNGAPTEWTYDAAGRVTSVTHRRGAEPFLVQTLAYNLDDTTASAAFSTSQLFLPPPSVTATYTAHDRIVAFGGKTPEYDADGNCLASPDGGFTAAYDALNRISALTRGGTTRTFTYDAQDRLVGWSEGGATRILHRDAAGRILFESDASGNIVALHLRHGGQLLARGLPETGWIYYHFDRNGNTLALTNAAGETVAGYQYQPFGVKRVAGAAGDNFLTYGGGHGVIDHEGGLFHMGRRAYHAETQRFLQQDPIGFAGGDNLYAYANGNPVDFIDPQGTFILAAIGVASLGYGIYKVASWGYGMYKKVAKFADSVENTLGTRRDVLDKALTYRGHDREKVFARALTKRNEAAVEAGAAATEFIEEAGEQFATTLMPEQVKKGLKLSKRIIKAGNTIDEWVGDSEDEDSPPEE